MSNEIDLCTLMKSMSVTSIKEKEDRDVDMFGSQSIWGPGTSESLNPDQNFSADGSYGCSYLRAIKQRLDSTTTTNGEYLDVIFMHRGITSASPSAHRDCARGFSDIAHLLEKRAWRADRDSDLEAVAAFRYEAWSIVDSLHVSNE